jgi:hypothetical protein
MNKLLIVLSAVFLLLTGCASSVTKDIIVDTDVDPKANLKGYSSYAWLGSASIVYDPEGQWEPPQFDMDNEVKFLIDRELRAHGMTETNRSGQQSANPGECTQWCAHRDTDRRANRPRHLGRHSDRRSSAEPRSGSHPATPRLRGKLDVQAVKEVKHLFTREQA